MLIPKYFLLSVLILLFSPAVAQDNKNKNLKNKWLAGISFGNASIKGEVTALFPQSGWGTYIQKPITKWFAVQLYYTGGIARGLNLMPAYNYGKNEAWSTRYNAPVIVQEPNGSERLRNSADGTPYTSTSGDPVYYNYRTVFHQLSLQARFSYTIETIKPRIGFYALLGAGGLSYKTKVDALDGTGYKYAPLFRSINNTYQTGGMDKGIVLKELNASMDHTYETNAEADEQKKPITQVFQPGIGITIHLNNKIQIGLEYLVSFTNQTLLDGQRWNEKPIGDATIARYFDRFNYASLHLCYGF